MKKITYLFIVTLFITSCNSGRKYVIKGKIEGSDSITFYLQKRDAGKIITIDSAKSIKGSFTMKAGAIDYPQVIQLVAGNTKKRTSFYLENAEITITGSLDSLYKAVIKGSKTQDEYQSFLDSNKKLSDIYSKTYIEFQTASQSGNAERAAILEKQSDSIQNEMKNLQRNFVRNSPASYVTPSILASLSYEMEPSEIESVINAMDTAVAAIPQMKLLKERVAIMKTVAIGQKAPDFTLNDVDGKPVALSSKIGAKLLLIDFWAAWCGPCREENPNLVKVFNEFNKKGLDIFGVSLDSNKEDWVKAIDEDKLKWTQVSDLLRGNSPVARLYAINAIPFNFLLDETGTIIGRNMRGEVLYNKVTEILGAKK
jgi:peroxiredoxin